MSGGMNVSARFNNFCDGYFSVSLNAKSIGKAVVKGTIGLPVSLIVALRNVAVGTKKLCNWTWSKLTSKQMNSTIAAANAKTAAANAAVLAVASIVTRDDLEATGVTGPDDFTAAGVIKSSTDTPVDNKTVIVERDDPNHPGLKKVDAVISSPHPRTPKKPVGSPNTGAFGRVGFRMRF